MTHPYIEKVLESFYAFSAGDLADDQKYAYSGFLATALQEVLIAGLELAEGAVPEPDTPWGGSARAAGFREGFGKCREETLSALATLKKTVVGGEEKV